MYPMVDSMDDWPSGTSLLVRVLVQSCPLAENDCAKPFIFKLNPSRIRIKYWDRDILAIKIVVL